MSRIKWHERVEQVCARHGVQSRWYHGKLHPFCFNVKMYCTLNFDKAFELMVREYDGGVAAAVLDIGGNMPELRHRFDAQGDQLYDFILQDMRRTFDTKDTDTMKFVSPKIEHRYRLKVPAKGFDVEYEFVGRSGGWLSLAKFEGWQLAADNPREYWVEALKEWPEDARQLCAMIEEIALMVGKKDDEFNYQAGFQLGVMVEQLGDRHG